jgi:hypothetical protein
MMIGIRFMLAPKSLTSIAYRFGAMSIWFVAQAQQLCKLFVNFKANHQSAIDTVELETTHLIVGPRSPRSMDETPSAPVDFVSPMTIELLGLMQGSPSPNKASRGERRPHSRSRTLAS